MKILNLHGSERGLINPSSNTPIGGLEKTVIDLHDILNEAGYDCWTITSKNDNLVGKFIEINPPQDSDVWSVSAKYNAYVKRLIAVMHKQQFTHVIVHGANRLASVLTRNGIQFLFIEHIMDKSVNKLYHERHFSEVVPRARANGSKFYSVSEYAMTNIERRVEEQNLATDFRFDGYIKLQYITKELSQIKTKAAQEHFITIGRCDSNKDPAGAIGVCKKLNVPLRIYVIMSDTNEKEQEYYRDKLASVNDNLFVNHPRSEMLEDLTKAAIYVSTAAHESAGITALEALACGVPVMLLTNKDTHASLMFAPENEEYIKCMPKNDIDMSWVKSMSSLTPQQREEIQSITFRHNSKEAVIYGLIKALDEMKPMTHNTNLESFFA